MLYKITHCVQHIHDIVKAIILNSSLNISYTVSQAQSGSEMFQAFHALSQFVCTLCIVIRPTHKPYME